eukprot:TRINITY_DN6875_c0_g1_i1.p1 TRINITY_DN6875_c0_g1~~TRINITY_DN6875_c0_g1_i1.p1  ORF type:complete len:324 (+),score=119.73 TRINITY_DN6875_c0_g1_i1:50-1021(+)
MMGALLSKVVSCSAGLVAVLVLLRVVWGRWRHAAAVAAVDDFYERWESSLKQIAARPGRHVTALMADATQHKVTVFFFHGSCARMGQFSHQIEAAQKAGARVIAFDAIGCGRSAVPKDPAALAPTQLVEDAAALFEEHADGTPAVLVGHSFGTHVAKKVAARFPSAVASLVLIGPPPPMSDATKVRQATAVFQLPNWALWLIRPVLSAGFQKMALAPAAPVHLRRQEAEASSRGSVHAFASYWRRMADLAEHPVDFDSIAQIPAVLITGKEDKITPPSAAQTLQARLPQARLLVIDDASHQVMQEAHARVSAVVVEQITLAVR